MRPFSCLAIYTPQHRDLRERGSGTESKYVKPFVESSNRDAFSRRMSSGTQDISSDRCGLAESTRSWAVGAKLRSLVPLYEVV